MSRSTGGKPATRVVHTGGGAEPATGALATPIYPVTTYERDADGGYSRGRSYARDDNPTFAPAEALLADLEGGAEALLFSSGMAAATAVFQALQPGDHVVAAEVMYWALKRWLSGHAARWGLDVEFVPMDDLEALKAAVRPGETKLVWIETPGNPLWTITDIAAAAEIAHAAGARLAADNTVPTPVLTRPIEHGADIVMHSATKYLNGHSDVVGGALIAAVADEFWQRLRWVRVESGSMPGPFEAWLLLRGMRTLVLRVRECSRNAAGLADRLAAHPAVGEVLYPGLASHPGHAVAARQMADGAYGGMLSLRVAGGEGAAMRVAAATRLFVRATSLGGVESLIEHRASMEGAHSLAPTDLLRLSVGIEDVDDLWGDLETALASV